MYEGLWRGMKGGMACCDRIQLSVIKWSHFFVDWLGLHSIPNIPPPRYNNTPWSWQYSNRPTRSVIRTLLFNVYIRIFHLLTRYNIQWELLGASHITVTSHRDADVTSWRWRRKQRPCHLDFLISAPARQHGTTRGRPNLGAVSAVWDFKSTKAKYRNQTFHVGVRWICNNSRGFVNIRTNKLRFCEVDLEPIFYFRTPILLNIYQQVSKVNYTGSIW